MITIDPDDTELKDAINDVENKKRRYINADKGWNRSQKPTFLESLRELQYNEAKTRYESALINLALIVMERL